MFKLFRIASNASSGSVVKGTPDNKPTRYVVNTMALLAGIAIQFPTEADRTRFANVEILLGSSDEAGRLKLDRTVKAVDAEFGRKAARRMMNRFDQYQTSLGHLRTALRMHGFDERGVDLYGQLVAAAYTLTSDTPLGIETAREAVAWLRESEDDRREREAACLAHLLGSSINGVRTIGQQITMLRQGDDSEEDDLVAAGIRYDGDRDEILIANRAPGLQRVFRLTPWADGQHAVALKRMGATTHGKSVRFGGTVSKALIVDAVAALGDRPDPPERPRSGLVTM